MRDKRHPSYIDHALRDLLAQRIYQIASGYADGNDANMVWRTPLGDIVRAYAGAETLCPSAKALLSRDNHSNLPFSTLAQELDCPQNVQSSCL